MQNSLCVQVLHSLILAALLHDTRAACLSQTFWSGTTTRNGITELLQRQPPTFGWPAITLGIGPHSSYVRFRFFTYQYYIKGVAGKNVPTMTRFVSSGP